MSTKLDELTKGRADGANGASFEVGPGDHVDIAIGVIRKITAAAVDEIDGIHLSSAQPPALQKLRQAIRGEQPETDGILARMNHAHEVTLHLHTTVDYGMNIPALADAVERNVAEKIESMTGLQTREVRISIDDIALPEDHPEPAPERS